MAKHSRLLASESNTPVDRIRRGTRQHRALYDAFPTKAGAVTARDNILETQPACQPSVRKLAKPQDSGRLKYGVFIVKSCDLGRGL